MNSIIKVDPTEKDKAASGKDNEQEMIISTDTVEASGSQKKIIFS